MCRGDRSECGKKEEKTHVRLGASRQVEGYGAEGGNGRELGSVEGGAGRELESTDEEQPAVEEVRCTPVEGEVEWYLPLI